MFSWIKGKAQDAVYATTIEAIAARTSGDHAALAAINVCAALVIVQLIRNTRDQFFVFDDLCRINPSISTLIAPADCGVFENLCLQMAKDAKNQSRYSDLIFQLSAGYFSAQKRQAFKTETTAAITSAIRLGAKMCIQLNINADMPISEAHPTVIERLSKVRRQ